ncbi:MAG: diguanylate cyclase [Dehalococcoidia bacterium]
MVAFSLVVLPISIWVATNEAINEARDRARSEAEVATGNIHKPSPRPAGDGPLDDTLMESLHVKSVQTIDREGNVIESWGELPDETVSTQASIYNGKVQFTRGYSAIVSESGLAERDINPVDVLLGGDFASVAVFGPPQGRPTDYPEVIRVVIGMDDLTSNARTMLYRTVAFAGGLLAVALAGMWVLLKRFVSKPLVEYSKRARQIAGGSPVRMPDMGGNEFGELGTAINSMADTLREQATVDTLTGLYNLRHFEGEFPRMTRQARASGQPLALVNIDVDNLKPVNDTYGHATGDLVLQAISNCLLMWTGEGGNCWRTGGDEFAAALPNCDTAKAARAVTNLSELVEATPLDVDGSPIRLSVSVGFAIFPTDARTVEALTSIADQRMYERKVEARSRDAA